MRIAVIGAGPAGFYASAALLRRFADAHIDLIERLPVPFGLVRYGVAPDHPSTRNVISQFSSLMDDNPRLSYFGNVYVGGHPGIASVNSKTILPYDHLSSLYDAIIFATGAARPRTLHIPHGSDQGVPDVHSAHDFVLWLNGHPDLHEGGERQHVGKSIAKTLMKAERVAVVGAGNVAIDISRILLRPRQDVMNLEASPTALRTLSKAPPVQNVDLFARRAPPFARWTTASLREVCTKVPGVIVRTDVSVVRASTVQPSFKPSRTQARMLDVLANHTVELCSATKMPPSTPDSGHTLTLTFNTAVNGFSRNSEKLQLHLTKTRATHNSGNSIQVRTDKENYTCDATFLSLGYESGDRPPVGLAVGWANGMARGIIGDNKWDAESVVTAMSVPSSDKAMRPGVQEWLRGCSHNAISWSDWLRIDAEEIRRGRQNGCIAERCRIETVKEMLQVVG